MKKLFAIFCLGLVLTNPMLAQSGSLVSGGITRTFRYHLPNNTAAANLPIVLCFHGAGGSGLIFETYSGFDAVADANQFIAVYPDATVISGVTQWNAYADDIPGHAGVSDPNAADDVQFTRDLIAYFQNQFQINCKKVYASGHSSGGFMCYNLALQLRDKIAAIAPVAGNLWGDVNFVNATKGSIPIFHVHGAIDNVVTPPDLSWPYPIFLYMENTSCDPASPNLLSSYPNLNQNTYVFNDYNYPTGCSVGDNYKYVNITNWGHNWPIDDINEFNPALEIWKFVNKYQVNCTNTAIEVPQTTADLAVIPNPNQGTFTLKHLSPLENVQLLGLDGKAIEMVVLRGETETQLRLNQVVQGVYLLKWQLKNGEVGVSKVMVTQ